MEAEEAVAEGEDVAVEVSLVVLITQTRALPLKVKLKVRDGARMLPQIQPCPEGAEGVHFPGSAPSNP